MGHPGAPSGVGGGNPGDAGGASDQRAARERYRNALFDREAKAATALLEQVRHYVGRSGKCHVSDFEDLCTIHHAISNLYQRVRRFSNVEAMPRVYRNAVKGPAVGPNERPTAPTQNEAELLILNSDGLEVKAEDDVSAAVLGASTASVPLVALEAAAPSSPPPLFDLVRKVPEITVQELCRGPKATAAVATASRPNSRNATRKRPQPKVVTGRATPPRPGSSPRTPERSAAPSPPVAVAELFLEVFLELNGPVEGQEMHLEIQICEMPSRSPLRSLRITNKHGSVGTVVLEIHRLRRAELCMALVKTLSDSDRPRLGWDESQDFSVLNPDGRSTDVLSALRVPVTQLLAACAAGASLEWEADRQRCLVVRGSLLRAGKAVEYIPGAKSGAKSPEPAGNGFQAAQNLRAGESKKEEEEVEPRAAMVSRYVGRVLLRSSMKLRKRAEALARGR